MKTSIITFASLLLSTQSFAKSKCMTDAIAIYKETGFGISFGGGNSGASFGETSYVNVPLSINGEQACFAKKTAFQMKSESKKDKADKNKIIVTPMVTDFENVPDGHQKQYVFVEKDANDLLTKFHVMSFICAGEIPLSVEATSDSVFKIMTDGQNVSMKASTVFATGIAAKNIYKNMGEKTSAQPTFDFFNKIYLEKTHKELVEGMPCCTDYRVPSILTDTSIKSLTNVERAITSSFTTMHSKVPNGCSKDFVETMKNYQLENYSANESLKDYKIKKKGWFSDDLVFEW